MMLDILPETPGPLISDVRQNGAGPDLLAEALFASDLQPSEHPGTALIRGTVTALVFSPGELACAAVVAQEYGDHPEAACCRMVWAREAVLDAFALEVAR
jgi:hypothetical protein